MVDLGHSLSRRKDRKEKRKLHYRLDGLSSRPLCQRGLQLAHRQPDDLIPVLLVFDGHRQLLHVEIDDHVFKLLFKKNNNRKTSDTTHIAVVYLGWMQSRKGTRHVTHILWQVGVGGGLAVADGSVEFGFLGGRQQLVKALGCREGEGEG